MPHHPRLSNGGSTACKVDACGKRGVKTYSLCQEHADRFRRVEHSCAFTGCPEKWENLAADKYCDSHRCELPGCEDVREQNLRCRAHQPQAPVVKDCSRDDCSNPRKKRSSVCKEHSQCRHDECALPPVGNALVCAKHKCRNGGCDVQIDPAESTYCEEHVCAGFMSNSDDFKCKIHKAYLPKGESGDFLQYCPLHICRKTLETGKLCPEYNENRVFCASHRCKIPYCDRRRLYGTLDNSRLAVKEYCSVHADLAFNGSLQSVREALTSLEVVDNPRNVRFEEPDQPVNGPRRWLGAWDR